jgi:hypothetical protein
MPSLQVSAREIPEHSESLLLVAAQRSIPVAALNAAVGHYIDTGEYPVPDVKILVRANMTKRNFGGGTYEG